MALNPKSDLRITSACEFAAFEVVACHGSDAFFKFGFCSRFEYVVAVVVVVVVVE